MFVIRVAYPGGHSVWLTRRFPTATWGPEKDALPFPTEADAAEYNFAGQYQQSPAPLGGWSRRNGSNASRERPADAPLH
jgi:hypothetical protein